MHVCVSMKAIDNYTEIFAALSDKTRLRIIYLLIMIKQALCVCELVDSTEEPEVNISRHLKILKQSGLVEEYKEGRWKYYSITKNSNQFMVTLINSVIFIQYKESEKDLWRLRQRIQLRENGKCILGTQNPKLISRKKGV